MKTRTIIFVTVFLVTVFCNSVVCAQAPMKIDESMTMEEFQQTVLTKKDEVWVVDFWASWCRPCMQIIPELKAIHKNLDGEPVKFISVSWDHDEIAWRRGIQKTGMSWTQILVPNVRNAPFLTENFPHKYIPTMFIVLPSGKVKKVDETNLEKKVRKAIKKAKLGANANG